MLAGRHPGLPEMRLLPRALPLFDGENAAMTLASAFALLNSGRLRFSNPRQIEAHKYILKVLEHADHMRSCASCRYQLGHYCPYEGAEYEWEEARKLALGEITLTAPIITATIPCS